MITLPNQRLNIFHRARVKLTILYALLSLFLLTVFSFAAISAEERALNKIRQIGIQPEGRQQFRTRIFEERLVVFDKQFKDRLLIFDGALVMVAWFGSYWLSGLTLKPIHEMVTQQEDFAAEASHELRTPLSSINMEIEAFRRTQKTNLVTKELLNSIQEEVTRMKRMVDGLLILVRHTQPELSQSKQELDLEEIVQESVKQITLIAKTKKIKLTISLVPVKFQGNKEHLKQIFLILLDNAVKYTPQGGKIEISMKTEKSRIIVSVKDNGVGISKQDLPHIFKRFYRSKTSSVSEGTGLGLAIAQRLVRDYHGVIRAKSSQNVGSIFTVELPRQKFN